MKKILALLSIGLYASVCSAFQTAAYRPLLTRRRFDGKLGHNFEIAATRLMNVNPEAIRDTIYVPPDYLLNIVDGVTDTSVSVADVSSAGGVSLSNARQDLMKLASLTGADMQVTDSGDLLFVFPSNFMLVLRQRFVMDNFPM